MALRRMRCRSVFAGPTARRSAAYEPQPEMCPLIGIEELLRAAIALREFPRNCQSKSSQLETEAARPRTKKLSLHARRQTRPVVGDVDHSPLGDIAHVTRSTLRVPFSCAMPTAL
jgi:hypothetical protein